MCLVWMIMMILLVFVLNVVVASVRCPHQPQALTAIFAEWSLEEVCCFEQLVWEPVVSTLVVHEVSSVPDDHGWSDCQHCVWHEDHFTILSDAPDSNSGSGEVIVDLAWSNWGEFFYADHNDRYQAQLRSSSEYFATKPSVQSLVVIDRPVFLLPMITIHAGHVLVDLLEQVHWAMVKAYGEVRSDSLIVIDVAGRPERGVLQKKLTMLIHEQKTYASLLSLLSALPVLAMDEFRSMLHGRVVLFKSLHLGLDLSDSFMNRGHQLHPGFVSPLSLASSGANLNQRYKNFQRFVLQKLKSLSLDSEQTDSSANFMSASPSSDCNGTLVNIFVVQRSTNRRILNIDELASAVGAVPCSSALLGDFTDIPFYETVRMLQKTDVLIATAGSAFHNILFMSAGSTVVILMQPAWCPWAWMYANQALLLGIHPVVVCSGSDEAPFAHWTRRFWAQGPRKTKAEDVTVAVHIVVQELMKVIDTRMSVGGNEVHSAGPVTVYSTPYHSSFEGAASLKVLVTSVRSEKSQFADEWTLYVMGQLIVTGELPLHIVAQSFPRLAVCFLSFGIDETPSCVAMDAFNYYSDLIIKVDRPVQYLHLWLQTSASSAKGKLRGSDSFVVLDCRLGPSAGLDLVAESIGSTIDLSLTVDKQIVETAPPSPESIHIHQFVDTAELVQVAVTKLCLDKRLPILSCFKVVVAVLRYLAQKRLAAEWNLPCIQTSPSPQSPFVFLHIEKTAGTTLREALYQTARKLNLVPFIPCHGGIHCVTLSIEDHRQQLVKPSEGLVYADISIVAGHFSWNVWQQLPEYVSATRNLEHTTNASIPTPPCFIMGRHPVDRAISYYYQRCFQISDCIGYNRKMNELTSHEMAHIVLYERQGRLREDNVTVIILDEGMSDSACRAVADVKGTTGFVVNLSQSMTIPDSLTHDEMSRALRHVSKCVVGLQDRWDDTKRVLGHWFPWIDFSQQPANRRLMQLLKDKEDRDTLRPELRAIIEAENACDLELHNKMTEIFETQLKVLNFDYF